MKIRLLFVILFAFSCNLIIAQDDGLSDYNENDAATIGAAAKAQRLSAASLSNSNFQFLIPSNDGGWHTESVSGKVGGWQVAQTKTRTQKGSSHSQTGTHRTVNPEFMMRRRAQIEAAMEAQAAKRRMEEERRRRQRAENMVKLATMYNSTMSVMRARNAQHDQWMATEGIARLENIHATDFAEVPTTPAQPKLKTLSGAEVADLLKKKSQEPNTLKQENNQGFFIDPNKIYHLATWEETKFEQLHFVEKPMLSMEEHKTIEAFHKSFQEETGINISAILAKENKTSQDLQAISDYKAFRQEQLDEIEAEKNAAVMSALVYSDHDKSLEKETDFRPLTFSDILEHDREVFPLFDLVNTCNNAKDNEGFHAEIFFNEQTKEYTVAFRGTEMPPSLSSAIKFGKEWENIKSSYRDWIQTNLQQGLGYNSRQYDMAKEIGEKIKQLSTEKNIKINITGHSLGGGLATVAGVVSGNPTTVFNPAGVHENTFKKAGVLDKVQQGNYNIKRISDKNDVLTNIQEGNGIIYKVGNVYARSSSAISHAQTSLLKGKAVESFADSYKKDLPSAIGEKKVIETSRETKSPTKATIVKESIKRGSNPITNNPIVDKLKDDGDAHRMEPMTRLIIANNKQTRNAIENANEFYGI